MVDSEVTRKSRRYLPRVKNHSVAIRRLYKKSSNDDLNVELTNDVRRVDSDASVKYRRNRRQSCVPADGGYSQAVGKYQIMHDEANTMKPGSYGIVKLAYNEQDNNLYAMKVLDKIKITKKFATFRKPPPRKNKTTNAAIHANEPLAQVQREIAILRKLNHPNVVKLVEVLDDESDRFLYMVFEYIERGAVMEIPTNEYFTEDVAWGYFRDTVMGLEYLHFQKIIHRDIKPTNLLLSEQNIVKIADFGVSSEFEGIDAFLTGTAGTPAFMAPESLIEDNVAFYSGRAQDIWSLGITLFAFVHGHVPFVDNYVIALYKKIKSDPLEFPDRTPMLSDSLKNLIRGMLTKDPGLRMTLAEIKEHPWVTSLGVSPLPSEEENCHLITITDEDIANSVRKVPRIDTLILIKTMGKRKSFSNPFRRCSQSVGRPAPLFGHVPGDTSAMLQLGALKLDDLESADVPTPQHQQEQPPPPPPPPTHAPVNSEDSSTTRTGNDRLPGPGVQVSLDLMYIDSSDDESSRPHTANPDVNSRTEVTHV